MDKKSWYKSKAVWAGVASIVMGALYSVDLQFGTHITTSPVFGIVVSMLGAFGIYSRTTATTVLTK